jgi:hypothetical protein
MPSSRIGAAARQHQQAQGDGEAPSRQRVSGGPTRLLVQQGEVAWRGGGRSRRDPHSRTAALSVHPGLCGARDSRIGWSAALTFRRLRRILGTGAGRFTAAALWFPPRAAATLKRSARSREPPARPSPCHARHIKIEQLRGPKPPAHVSPPLRTASPSPSAAEDPTSPSRPRAPRPAPGRSASAAAVRG